MRVFISAGEASGDALGAGLVRALRRRLRAAGGAGLDVFGMGGPALRAEGLDARASAEEVSVHGLTDVVWAAPRLTRILRRLVRAAQDRVPAVAVLIDLPDFHLRLARGLRDAGVRVLQYVGPSVWAWRAHRVEAYASLVEEVLLLFPFELAWWRRRSEGGVRVRCVGHPLQEMAPRDRSARPRGIVLLPGSRPAEVRRLVPVFLEAARRLSGRPPASIVLAPGLTRTAVENLVPARIVDGVAWVDGSDDEARRAAICGSEVVAACAGTATLEVGLLGCPMVVGYRVDAVTWRLLRPRVHVQHLSLPNLLLGGPVVPELLQGDLDSTRLARVLERLRGSAGLRQTQALAGLHQRLGPTDASERAADAVLEHAVKPHAS